MASPWWFGPPQPQHTNEPMSFRQFLEEMKAFEEWQSSKNKTSKLVPAPEAWTTADYLVFIMAFGSITWIAGATIVLYNLTQFVKALPH